MIQYKELKKNLKKDLGGFPEVKISLVGDTATQFLATSIRGMGVERGYHIHLFEATILLYYYEVSAKEKCIPLQHRDT